jgi:hypothetical protein
MGWDTLVQSPVVAIPARCNLRASEFSSARAQEETHPSVAGDIPSFRSIGGLPGGRT